MAEHVGMDRSFISDLENGRKVQVERNWTMEQVSQKAGANDDSGTTVNYEKREKLDGCLSNFIEVIRIPRRM